MGGTPIYALAIVAFPRDLLPTGMLAEITRGGVDKATEAGCPIIGGHSIDDAEPKYGLAVTGTIHPERIVTNSGARPGDVLFLTKPLGTGVIATAIKRSMCPADVMAVAVDSMATLNRAASEAMVEIGVHAATDVTGYGLLGHLSEMTAGSGVRAIVRSASVPLLSGTRELAEAGAIPGGTRRNQESVASVVRFADGIDDITQVLLADAQTSGGLLIAVAAEKADTLQRALNARQVPGVTIGEIVAGEGISVS